MRTESSRLASSPDELRGVCIVEEILCGGVSVLFGVELLPHRAFRFDEAMMVNFWRDVSKLEP